MIIADQRVVQSPSKGARDCVSEEVFITSFFFKLGCSKISNPYRCGSVVEIYARHHIKGSLVRALLTGVTVLCP